jgi:hypothetical protein
MYINASFDFAAGATQTDISQFQNAVNIAINYFESVFTNLNVTLNVKFAYGEPDTGLQHHGPVPIFQRRLARSVARDRPQYRQRLLLDR